MNLYQPTITGSLSVSGSVNISGSITIAGGGTISGTASIATTALTASFVANAQTASYVLNAVSSSFALTASSADNLLVRNTLTAQTLVVQTITSSVDFVTGSTRFGSLSSNTHIITGSMYVTGAFYVASGSVGIGTSSPSNILSILANGSASTGADTTAGLTIYGDTQGSWLSTRKTSVTPVEAQFGADSTGSFVTSLTNHPIVFRPNNTERVRITNGGDVGIGTSTIYYTSTNRRVLEINGASSSFLAFKTGDVAKSYLFQNGTDFIITNLAAAGGYLALENNGAERMRISSAGLVTKPSQAYFLARGAYGTYSSTSTVVKLPYSTMDYNIGSYYNSSTSTFTAPTSGVYQFNWQMFAPPSQPVFAYLYINNVANQSIEWNNTVASYQTLWGGISRYLTSGDTVYLGLAASTGYQVHLNGGSPSPGSFFSGYLLG